MNEIVKRYALIVDLQITKSTITQQKTFKSPKNNLRYPLKVFQAAKNLRHYLLLRTKKTIYINKSSALHIKPLKQNIVSLKYKNWPHYQ